MTLENKVMLAGYAFAGALIVLGWDGPIMGLGIGLAGILTLINGIALALLIADARTTARRDGPVESMTAAVESIKPVITFVAGAALALALVVGSALIFIATGGFGL